MCSKKNHLNTILFWQIRKIVLPSTKIHSTIKKGVSNYAWFIVTALEYKYNERLTGKSVFRRILLEFSSGSFPEPFKSFFIPKFKIKIKFRIYHYLKHSNKKTNNPYRVKFPELHMVTKLFLESDKRFLLRILIWYTFLKLRLMYEKNN